MVGKTLPRNKEEQERIDFAKTCLGCLPCLLVKYLNSRANYNHVVEGGKRLGHMVGYPACLWHDTYHERWPDMTNQEMVGRLGPSFGHGKKHFEEFFGDELLLVETVDYAHELFKESPWQEFAMPVQIGRQILGYHADLMRKAA